MGIPFAAVAAGGLALQGAGALFGAKAQEKSAAAFQSAFAPTSEELETRQALLRATRGDIAKRQAVIDATDPALIQAAQNLERLLAGGEAPTLAPLREKIARDRAEMLNRVRQQLGPGGETSTAGRQIINSFDREARLQLSQAQQSRIGLLGQIAQRPDITGGGTAGLLQASLTSRQAAGEAASLGQLGALSRAQALGNIGQTATTIGTLGSLFGGGAGGAGGATGGGDRSFNFADTSAGPTSRGSLFFGGPAEPSRGPSSVRPGIPKNPGLNKFGPAF